MLTSTATSGFLIDVDFFWLQIYWCCDLEAVIVEDGERVSIVEKKRWDSNA